MKKLIILSLLLIGIGSTAKTQDFVPETANRWYFSWNTSNYFNDYFQAWCADSASVRLKADSLRLSNVWMEPFEVGHSTFSGITSTSVYTITHGLVFTPETIVLVPKSYDAANRHYYVSNITGSSFDIVFLVDPATGTNNLIFDWIAYK